MERRYLCIAELERLRRASLSPRGVLEGRLWGGFRSRRRGQGVEFDDYREFVPGDDASLVDWKVLGRTDRLYVKRAEHESEATITVVVDASASMGFSGMDGGSGSGGGGERKYDYACRVGAAIVFLAVQRRDRAGFAAVRGGLAEYVPHGAAAAQVEHVLDAMERVTPGGEARLAGALGELASRGLGRSVVVVLSDLFEDRAETVAQLAALRARGAEVVVFHVLHPEELELPDLENARFVDSETGRGVAVNVREVRARYEAALRGFLDGWAEACRGAGAEYRLVSTGTPYVEMLERWLVG